MEPTTLNTTTTHRAGVVVRALCGNEPLLQAAFRTVRDAVRALLPEAGTVGADTAANALVQAAG